MLARLSAVCHFLGEGQGGDIVIQLRLGPSKPGQVLVGLGPSKREVVPGRGPSDHGGSHSYEVPVSVVAVEHLTTHEVPDLHQPIDTLMILLIICKLDNKD